MTDLSSRIHKETVKHIAELARLEPDPDECERIADELGQVVEYVGQLDQVDTDDVEPLHHVLDLRNVLRDDEPHPSLSSDQALRNAPVRKGDFFLVPQVIKDKNKE